MGYDDDRDDDWWDDADGFYGYDDDRRAAYRRALGDFVYDDYAIDNDATRDDREFFIEFADMVQHYDATATGTHDDIDESRTFDDGTEFDANGDPVITYGVIISVVDAILEFGSFDDIPDDYEFSAGDDIPQIPDDFYRQRFPLYNPFKQRCKRPRAFRIDGRHPDSPPV